MCVVEASLEDRFDRSLAKYKTNPTNAGRFLSWIGFGFPSSLPLKKPTTFKLLQKRTEKLYCTFASRLKSFVVVNDESLYS